MGRMYGQDSLFTLSGPQIVGVLTISVILSLLMLSLTVLMTRRLCLWVGCGLAFGLFWGFVWVSPQVYYEYYRLILADLPAQWVIWPPQNLTPLRLLTFTGPTSLSAHGQGVLGWAMLLVTFLPTSRFRRNAAN